MPPEAISSMIRQFPMRSKGGAMRRGVEKRPREYAWPLRQGQRARIQAKQLPPRDFLASPRAPTAFGPRLFRRPGRRAVKKSHTWSNFVLTLGGQVDRSAPRSTEQVGRGSRK